MEANLFILALTDMYEIFVQDTELMDLRETIDTLRTRNEEAQAVIHGALNNPDNMKGLEMTSGSFCFPSISQHICLHRRTFASFDVEFSCLPDLRIRRQNSCESISSLNSLTSMSSMGSLKDQDAKKKKKKSWVRTHPACRAVFYSHDLALVDAQFILHSDNDIVA